MLSCLSHWRGHIEKSLVESALVHLVHRLVAEDRFNVSDELVKHDHLVILHSIRVEQEAFDGFKSLLVATFIVIVVDVLHATIQLMLLVIYLFFALEGAGAASA